MLFFELKLNHLLIKVHLFKEKLRSMSTLVIGAYLKQFNRVASRRYI